MPMHDPAHPGLIILHECIEPLGLTIEDAARVLGVEASELSEVVTCRASLTVEMAIRAAMAFGGSAQCWYRMQAACDISPTTSR